MDAVGIYAQTNIQLMNQLRAEGYAPVDLHRVALAYRFAMPLFSAQFRASGKPLLAHVVGVASVLARLRQPVPIVLCGLLHAVYQLGDFGCGSRGVTDSKRARVRAIVGAEGEELIYGYTRGPWDPATMQGIPAVVAAFTERERAILLIRLANELDDHLDLGILYCGNVERRRRYLQTLMSVAPELALSLGQPGLANELARVCAEVATDDVPLELRLPHEASFQLLPIRPPTRITRAFGRMWQRVGT